MITIDNDYMINERGYDLRANLKEHDNPSNMADIFLKQLSYRLYDYIIVNNIKFKSRKHIDEYLNADEERIEDFKRALAEQAIFLIVNGDPSLIIPETGTRADWNQYRIAPAAIDIFIKLNLMRTVMAEEEMFHDYTLIKKLNDPTRNW